MWTFTVTAYSLILILAITAIARKYKTVINPVSYFGCVFAIQTLIAPLLLSAFDLLNWHDVNLSDLIRTMWISALYFSCICIAFFCRSSPVEPLFRFCLPQVQPGIRVATFVVTFAIALSLYAILMAVSGAGLLWLSDSRMAYQIFREGAGVWWSLCQAALHVCFTCFLCRAGRSVPRVFAACFLFAILAYFLGSKGFVLGYLVIGVFFLEHHVRPVTTKALASIAAIVLIGILALQVLQGTASSLTDTVEYFDYFTNTSRFLSDFDKMFHHTYGQTALSELWMYVPRGLYPAKPIVYGETSIMSEFFPGIAEASGSTPGVLPWSESYLDFGIPGVAFAGLFAGFVGKAAFELFRTSGSIWNLLLLGQFGFLLGEMTFFRAPFPLFAIWMAANWLVLKLCSLPVFPPVNPVDGPPFEVTHAAGS